MGDENNAQDPGKDPEEKPGDVVEVAVDEQAAPDPLEKLQMTIEELKERLGTHDGQIEQIFAKQDEHAKREASQHRVKHYKKFREAAEEGKRAAPAVSQKRGHRFVFRSRG